MNAEFEVHLLNELGIQKAQKLAVLFDGLLTELLVICPPGRELSIVRTKLEEASFFGKKSIAKLVENQK